MIGILGGTFDPIHYAHLRCAVEAKELFGLEHVRLIPSANPPHRESPSAPPLLRAQMVELAIKNHAGLVCDRREIERHQQRPTSKSFMVDTLASLRRDFPSQPLLLFIGNDAFKQLTNWHCWRQLFDYAHIVVMTRPGFNRPVLDGFFQARFTQDIGGLGQCLSGNLVFQAVTALDISATAIRAGIARQQDPSFLLPDAVIEYIHQHQLYQSPG
ncbi:MAG: nicotinate-nucleotide adenylyltransferase [Methylovulum sp.]|uniref:nicotinate-nucleotide adenylyltransferase n=1 Tax=Methylovulum sp. TaxID=1916980 RepID=UPI00262FB214|nr:nicotinate-nucleotide adenylyltransferase [Methylovulum sp.]MDD2723763.1 nicotinate-nucleotide adenylyltransferase [Methylovulum sp.]MDD5123619.1 nicotinate-nucleotide adenylyltransferase [Methylovulum sp.]